MAFEELPFTSAAAEFDAPHTGSLMIAYIPTQDVAAQRAQLEKQEKYAYSPWYTFAFNALDFNFTGPTVGPVLKQLDIRQAFQSLINQGQYIEDFNAGIGSVTNGSVPAYPTHNTDGGPLEENGRVYPYDPKKAVALLKDNRWHVVPGGVSYCLKPGTGREECGAGIVANKQLTFSLRYPSGSAGLTSEMAARQSTMKQGAGINLQLKEEPVNQVTAVIAAGCTSASPCSDWEPGTEANTGAHGFMCRTTSPRAKSSS
jgi:peptide/nickel transport system substrate-binding protein